MPGCPGTSTLSGRSLRALIGWSLSRPRVFQWLGHVGPKGEVRWGLPPLALILAALGVVDPDRKPKVLHQNTAPFW